MLGCGVKTDMTEQQEPTSSLWSQLLVQCWLMSRVTMAPLGNFMLMATVSTSFRQPMSGDKTGLAHSRNSKPAHSTATNCSSSFRR